MHHDMPLVEILLPTYNGARFIRDQIESIQKQDYPNWILTIQDNGSSDTTLLVLDELDREIGSRLHTLAALKRPVGPARGFYSLLRNSSADYLALSDQDDYWSTDRVSITLGLVRLIEEQYPDSPVMVATDLVITGTEISDKRGRFWKENRIDPARDCRFPNLVFHNVVTGCTVMCNRKARNMALRYTEIDAMHDHLMAVVVANHGILAIIDYPTVYYRQHGSNAVGSRSKLRIPTTSSIKGMLRSFRVYSRIASRLDVRWAFCGYFDSKLRFAFRQFRNNWKPTHHDCRGTSELIIHFLSRSCDLAPGMHKISRLKSGARLL
jgi:glycosyltransferase involved in cell wall biosynthesis